MSEYNTIEITLGEVEKYLWDGFHFDDRFVSCYITTSDENLQVVILGETKVEQYGRLKRLPNFYHDTIYLEQKPSMVIVDDDFSQDICRISYQYWVYPEFGRMVWEKGNITNSFIEKFQELRVRALAKSEITYKDHITQKDIFTIIQILGKNQIITPRELTICEGLVDLYETSNIDHVKNEGFSEFEMMVMILNAAGIIFDEQLAPIRSRLANKGLSKSSNFQPKTQKENMLSETRPHTYPECQICAYASARIELEKAKAKAKYGELDTHRIAIECSGSGNLTTMWVYHTGIRYAQGGVQGIKFDDIMLSGGEYVKCPGSK